MNKVEFFHYCDRAEKHHHQLALCIRRESRGFDNVLELTGSTWCRGGLTGIEIYRPLRGRQGTGAAPYKIANARLVEAREKFARWLVEWATIRGVALMYPSGKCG